MTIRPCRPVDMWKVSGLSACVALAAGCGGERPPDLAPNLTTAEVAQLVASVTEDDYAKQAATKRWRVRAQCVGVSARRFDCLLRVRDGRGQPVKQVVVQASCDARQCIWSE